MGWTTGIQVCFLAGTRVFSFLNGILISSGRTQPPMQWVLGAVFPGVNWHGCDGEHALPSSAKVKNGSSVPPLLPSLQDMTLN
jgi:hypothetical protein